MNKIKAIKIFQIIQIWINLPYLNTTAGKELKVRHFQKY